MANGIPSQAAAATPPPDATPDMTGASWDGLIRAAAKGLKSDEEIISQLKDSAKAERDVAKSIGDFKMPDPPAAPQLPPPPQPQFHSPMQEFGSLASTLAIFGSLLTRHPLTSALNASAGAMRAISQGDYQTYRMGMDNWKTQTDYAMKVADYQNQRYQQILDNEKFTIQQKLNLLSAESAANQDLVAASKLRSDGIDGLANLLMNRTRLQIAMSRAIGGATAMDGNMKEYQLAIAEGFKGTFLDFMREKSGMKSSALTQRQQKISGDASKLIDQLQTQLAQAGEGLGVTGIGGMASRAWETVKTLGQAPGKGVQTPASDFQAGMARLRAMLPILLTGQGRSSADVRAMVDEIAPGLELGATAQKTKEALDALQIYMVPPDSGATPSGGDGGDTTIAPQDDPLGLFDGGGGQ